jgi:hypothetical protein
MKTVPRYGRGSTLIYLSLLASFLLLTSSVTSAQEPPKANRAAAEHLTLSLMALHGQYQASRPEGKAALLLQLRSAAAKRQQVLSSLIQTSPGEVLRVAIPAEVRDAMPEAARNLVEQHVKLQGKVQVAIEDGRDYSRIHYGLIVAGNRLELHFAGNAPTNWLTDMTAQVSGVQVGNQIALTLSDATVVE